MRVIVHTIGFGAACQEQFPAREGNLEDLFLSHTGNGAFHVTSKNTYSDSNKASTALRKRVAPPMEG